MEFCLIKFFKKIYHFIDKKNYSPNKDDKHYDLRQLKVTYSNYNGSIGRHRDVKKIN